LYYYKKEMSTKFLTSTGSNTSLSDGSATVFVNSLSASSLSASMAVKTNGINQLISSNLDIHDVNGLQDALNGASLPTVLPHDLSIGSYDITGLPFGQTLKGLNSTVILQTSTINDTSNRVQNITNAIVDETTMSGKLKVSQLACDSITNSVNADSSISMFGGSIDLHGIGNLTYNNKPVITTPYVNQIEAGGFKKTGGSNQEYLMSDGSVLLASANSGNSNYYLYNNITTLTATPGNGNVSYNSSSQSNAGQIFISHLTRDTIDVEIFFKQLSSTLTDVYIQDQESSLNYIQYNITGTPTITSEFQVTIPVSLRTGAGTGLTTFGNNHNIVVSFFTNSIEVDARLSTLDSKTQNQTSISGTTTFGGVGGVIANKFSVNGGLATNLLLADGSTTGVSRIEDLETKTLYQSIVGGSTSFSTGLRINGAVYLNGSSILDVATINRPYYGLQYQHNSASVPTVQSSSLITAFGSTALSASPWVKTNNYTRQYGCGLWTTGVLTDGAVCGYGGTVSTGAYVTMDLGSTFGLSYNLAIADSTYNSNNCQNFFGLWWLQTSIPLNQSTQLNVQRNMLCFGSSTNDPNICIYSGGATTTTKWVDLGGYFPSNIESNGALTNFFKFLLYWDGTTVYYRADNTTFPDSVAGAHVTGQFTPLPSQIPTASCTNQCVRIMGTPLSNGQAKLKVQRFGVF
jgi:hypothetical protein